MVSHDDQGRTRIRHGAYRLQDLYLLRSTVDQVSYEDRLSGRMSVGAGHLDVSEAGEQFDQLVMAAVDIADDIETRTFQIQRFATFIWSDDSHVTTVRAGCFGDTWSPKWALHRPAVTSAWPVGHRTIVGCTGRGTEFGQ